MPENQDGNSGDWKESLPEEIRNAPGLQGVKDVDSLAQQFLELQRYTGNSVRLPPKDASAEEQKKFMEKVIEASDGRLMPGVDPSDPDSEDLAYKALGKPGEAKGYELPKPAEGEGQVDESAFEGIRVIAHKVGLTQKQFDNYLGIAKEEHEKSVEAFTEAQEKAMAKLKDEWGMDVDRRMGTAKAFALKYGSEKVKDSFENNYADDSDYKAFYNLSQMAPKEAAEIASQGVQQDTPMELKEKYDRIMDKIAELDDEKTSANMRKQSELMEKAIAIKRKMKKGK